MLGLNLTRVTQSVCGAPIGKEVGRYTPRRVWKAVVINAIKGKSVQGTLRITESGT